MGRNTKKKLPVVLRQGICILRSPDKLELMEEMIMKRFNALFLGAVMLAALTGCKRGYFY